MILNIQKCVSFLCSKLGQFTGKFTGFTSHDEHVPALFYFYFLVVVVQKHVPRILWMSFESYTIEIFVFNTDLQN